MALSDSPPPKSTGVMRWDPATASYVVDHEQAAVVVERQAKQVVQVSAANSYADRVDLLRRWGAAVQDAALVASPELLKLTVAIKYADEFLMGKGVVGGDGSGSERGGSTPRKKTIAVFSGPLGVGKTIAATHVMANGSPHRIVGAWTSQNAPLFVHAESVFAGAKLIGEADTKMRRSLERAQILVIDDLGLEKDPRKTFQPYMDWLINTRYGGDGWLVLTTNLTAEDFRRRYGERIYDRLKHRACWYEIAHESLRGQP
jgi:hypothetical protein